MKVSTAEMVFEAETEGSMLLWMQEDLRTDYVLMAHEHPLSACQVA